MGYQMLREATIATDEVEVHSFEADSIYGASRRTSSIRSTHPAHVDFH